MRSLHWPPEPKNPPDKKNLIKEINMTYSIIGAGKVGIALARHFAHAGIEVSIANTRGPASLADLVKELGSTVKPVSLQDALAADTIIFAIPFRAHSEVAGALASWNGKIVVDAMNAYGIAPEELQGMASTEVLATALPGARVVKSFNQLPAALLAADPAYDQGRRVMFVAADDAEASTSIAHLATQFGFAPIQLGRIDEGGRLLKLNGPLLLQNLIKLS
ncbi:NADPH-dependent F420 reductase [Undibacterium sp. Tian12W]|uniref:NADPH-dependent F420 reductase n=1 Tax=Undibacterium sp. Tian12W TaxID=3413054 RepID=UPI003BF22B42